MRAEAQESAEWGSQQAAARWRRLAATHWACFPARIGVATHLHVSSALRSNNCGVHRSAVLPPPLRTWPLSTLHQAVPSQVGDHLIPAAIGASRIAAASAMAGPGAVTAALRSGDELLFKLELPPTGKGVDWLTLCLWSRESLKCLASWSSRSGTAVAGRLPHPAPSRSPVHRAGVGQRCAAEAGDHVLHDQLHAGAEDGHGGG